MTSDEFVKEFCWSLETLQIAREAKFSCVYCRHYFFKSVDAWTQFNVDHLRPGSNGERDERIENKVVACWTCNKLKSNFDPGKDNEHATRSELIKIAEKFIREVRERRSNKVKAMKEASAKLV
jgi:5-methylcytosine-specific restriction endonuclease McrA